MRVGDEVRGDLELLGDRLVEAVLALQQLVDPAQERARLGALDDPVVVGGGHRHHLRDPERPDLLGRRVGPFGRIGDRAGGDDRALPGEQPRDRGDGAEPARVGERDVGALEVVGGELVLARLGDQVLVVGVEAREVEALGALDAGDHEAAPALALDVDRDPEVDARVLDHMRLGVDLGVAAAHHRPLDPGADDRPRDQVGERDLHPAVLERAVDRLALRVQRVDRQRPERCRGGNRARLVHRLGEHRRRAAERLRLAGGRGGRSARPVACGGEDVALDHLAAGARTAHRAEVHALRGGNSTGDGGGLRIAVAGGVGGRRGRRGGRCACGRFLVARCSLLGSRSGGDLGQSLADLHGVVGRDQQLRDRAADRGRHLGVDLVGRDLDHGVALGDRVALGHVPLEHGALGDGFAHLRHRQNS